MVSPRPLLCLLTVLAAVNGVSPFNDHQLRPTTVFVATGGGSGSGCGLSDRSPCATLHLALATASSCERRSDRRAGVEVVIAAGIYGSDNCGVVAHTPLTLRGNGSDVTVIDCDHRARWLLATASVSITGITLRHGYVNDSTGGGAVAVVWNATDRTSRGDSEPTLSAAFVDVVWRGNVAAVSASATSACDTTSMLCAPGGGGVAVVQTGAAAAAAAAAVVSCVACVFVDNTVVADATDGLVGVSGSGGGALVLLSSASATVILADVHGSGNVAATAGGAVAIGGCGTIATATVSLSRVHLSNNTAKGNRVFPWACSLKHAQRVQVLLAWFAPARSGCGRSLRDGL